MSAHSCTTPAGATVYASDKNGNRTTGGLSYDTFDRLSAIGTNALSSLSPDNGELVGDGTTALTNSSLGLDSASTGGARTDYLRDPQGTLVGEHTSAGTRYVTPDSRGSTRWWNGAAPDKTLAYDPDGNATSSGAGAASHIGFDSGYQAGAGTSTPLLHFGARYYDPTVGRWTQPDPQLQPADVRQANPWAFAGGDPIDLLDPEGQSIFGDIFVGLGDAVAIASCATVETGVTAGLCVAGLTVATGASADAADDIGKRRRGEK